MSAPKIEISVLPQEILTLLNSNDVPLVYPLLHSTPDLLEKDLKTHFADCTYQTLIISSGAFDLQQSNLLIFQEITRAFLSQLGVEIPVWVSTWVGLKNFSSHYFVVCRIRCLILIGADLIPLPVMSEMLGWTNIYGQSYDLTHHKIILLPIYTEAGLRNKSRFPWGNSFSRHLKSPRYLVTSLA